MVALRISCFAVIYFPLFFNSFYCHPFICSLNWLSRSFYFSLFLVRPSFQFIVYGSYIPFFIVHSSKHYFPSFLSVFFRSFLFFASFFPFFSFYSHNRYFSCISSKILLFIFHFIVCAFFFFRGK